MNFLDKRRKLLKINLVISTEKIGDDRFRVNLLDYMKRYRNL